MYGVNFVFADEKRCADFKWYGRELAEKIAFLGLAGMSIIIWL
jgi:hypothetical protein